MATTASKQQQQWNHISLVYNSNRIYSYFTHTTENAKLSPLKACRLFFCRFLGGLPTGLLKRPTKGGAFPEGGNIATAVFFIIGLLLGIVTVKVAAVAVIEPTDSLSWTLYSSPEQY